MVENLTDFHFQKIYLAGGCFWGLEKYLQSIPGVLETEVGYANGNTMSPSYEDVCHHGTGHAETVSVQYDPEKISLSSLLDLYYEVIDPLSINQQGNDKGSQYRTGIYYVNLKDKAVIESSIAKLQDRHEQPVAIEVKPLENYYKAEEYHQKYLDKHPEGYCHIPKEKLEQSVKLPIDATRYTPLSPVELKQKLTGLQYKVTQKNATEPPFQNQYWDHFEQGVYVDITSGEPLFLSGSKFDAGCGWPSFCQPIDPDAVREFTDTSHGMLRREVRSRVGDAHLGHVFNDGPKDRGGQRYCINSASLRFVSKDNMEQEGYGYLLPYLD